VASKYWDADAPSERATKRLAKKRLLAIREAEIAGVGIFYMAKQGIMRECIVADSLQKAQGGNCLRSYASLAKVHTFN
jgi:hypothetical protein